MFAVIAVISLALDVLTKYIVSSKMVLGQTVELIPGIFDICYVFNKGAAFGIFYGRTWLLVVVTLAMLIALIIYYIKCRKGMLVSEEIAIALVFSGGLGNLASRMLQGGVVDFFNCYIWPVFNVADIAITCGCILLLISVIIIEPRKNKDK